MVIYSLDAPIVESPGIPKGCSEFTEHVGDGFFKAVTLKNHLVWNMEMQSTLSN